MQSSDTIIIACSCDFFAQGIKDIIQGYRKVSLSIAQNDKELKGIIHSNRSSLVLIEDIFHKNITPYIMGTLLEKYPRIRFAVFSLRDLEPHEAAIFLDVEPSILDFRHSVEEIMQGISQVISGNNYVSESIEKTVDLKHIMSFENKTLTKREKTILLMLYVGQKPIKIAEDLGIKKGTVRIHKNNIYAKCKIHNQIDLIKFVNSLKKYDESMRTVGEMMV